MIRFEFLKMHNYTCRVDHGSRKKGNKAKSSKVIAVSQVGIRATELIMVKA
jgi:hypothetical protein